MHGLSDAEEDSLVLLTGERVAHRVLERFLRCKQLSFFSGHASFVYAWAVMAFRQAMV
jgi:hypothetical protein